MTAIQVHRYPFVVIVLVSPRGLLAFRSVI